MLNNIRQFDVLDNKGTIEWEMFERHLNYFYIHTKMIINLFCRKLVLKILKFCVFVNEVFDYIFRFILQDDAYQLPR